MYNIFFGRRKKFEVNNAESTYKVHYLGNVMTSLIKGGYCHGSSLNGSLNESNSHNTNNNQFNEKTNYKNLNQDFNFINTTKLKLDTNSSNKCNETSTDDDEIDSNYSNYIYLNKNLNDSDLSSNNIRASVDKPVKILWDNHLKHNGQAGLKMKLTLTQGGLKVDTKDHGLTEYYGHRIHFVQAHPSHPKLFVWVYQHVGKNLKTEIRCHAALCQRARDSKTIETLLNDKLQRTFLEYKREKRRQQNSRLCNTKNGGLLTGQLGTRKRTFRITRTYKPPVQHGMCSAPKLDDVLEEEEDEKSTNIGQRNNRLSLRKRISTIVKEKAKNLIVEEDEDDESQVEETSNENLFFQESHDINEPTFVINENEEMETDEDDGEMSSDVEREEEEEEEDELEIQLELKNIESKSSDLNSELGDNCFYQSDHYELTETSISQINSKIYDNRPVTQQLILSSSSSSSTSSNTTSPSQSHYSSSASSSNENALIQSNSNQNQVDVLVKRINSLNLKAQNLLEKSNNRLSTKSNNILLNGDFMPKSAVEINTESNHRGFTEVSYEFLSDLSKTNTDQKNESKKIKLTHSKSFTKNLSQNKSSTEQAEANRSSFSNPFCRSNVSKSFSAFTTRLKYQAILSENVNNKKSINNQSFFQNINTCNKNESLVLINKNIIHSNSPLPSPTLSTCSNSSSSHSNSSSNGIITESTDLHIISSL